MAGPFDDLLSQYGLSTPERPTPFHAMPEEEKQGILRQLANLGVGGLQALNYVLDLPGRPVRAALAGRFGDVLPSIINPSRAPSGEELAKQWGLLQGEGTKGQFELRDLVGPAVEIATNPTSYINPIAPLVGGARTAAGNVAAKAGRLGTPLGATTGQLAGQAITESKLAPTLASRIAAGQGSLFNLGLPFTEGLPIGTGPGAQALAESIGGVQSALGATAPARYAKALFASKYGGTPSAFLQPVLARGEELAKPAVAEGRAAVTDLARMLGPDGGRAEVAAYQGMLPPGFINTPADVLYGINEGYIPSIPGSNLAQVAGGFEQIGRDLPLQQQAKGVKSVADIAGADLGGYAPSSISREHLTDPGFRLPGSRPQLPLEGAQIARDVPRGNVIGGRLGINAGSLRPDIGGAIRSGMRSAEDVEATILSDLMGVTPAQKQMFDTYSNIPGQHIPAADVAPYQAVAAKVADARELAPILGNLNPQTVSKGVPFYNSDYLGEWTRRLTSAGQTEAKATAMIEGLQRVAKPASAFAGSDSLPLKDIMEKYGFGSGAKALIDPTLHVPTEVAKDVGRYVDAFTRPEAVGPLLQLADSYTNLFKVGASTIFPASRMRDMWQNVFMNFVKGNRDTRYSALNPLSYYKPYEDAAKTFLRGGIVADAHTIPAVRAALGDVTPEVATKWIADQAAAFGTIVPNASEAAIQKGGEVAAQRTFVLPGERAPGVLSAFREGTYNPLDVYGVPGKQETRFAPALAGNRAIEQIDNVGRGAAIYAQLRQGASMQAAARAAMEAMYDYGNLSKFERSVMRRVIPFYSFMRQNIPAQLEEIIKNPGGGIANMVRVTESLRNQQGFVPENIGEGLALPIGTDETTGKQRYLTHFGLPFEEALGPLTGSVKGTLANIISQSNPMIRGPVEYATGQSTYTGRPLGEGDTLLNQVLANSPLSRIASTARNLASPSAATALELASPFKVREANVQGAQNAAVKDAIGELLQGNPVVRQGAYINVPKAQRGLLTPKEQLLLQIYQDMQNRKPVSPQGL